MDWKIVSMLFGGIGGSAFVAALVKVIKKEWEVGAIVGLVSAASFFICIIMAGLGLIR